MKYFSLHCRRMATSKRCHQGTCGPCILCKSESVSKYTHAEKFNDETYSFLCNLQGTAIDKCACICYPCAKQMKRNINNPNYEPRWRSKPSTQQPQCSIKDCKNTLCKRTKLASVEDIEHILQQPVVSFTVEESVTTVGLCRDHYNLLYTQLHVSATCESCDAKPKKGECFTRHCPAPDSVNTYLSLLSSDPSHLTDESLICHACYKHFH